MYACEFNKHVILMNSMYTLTSLFLFLKQLMFYFIVFLANLFVVNFEHLNTFLSVL